MPSRILKESICSSDSINELSSFEETFFYRLIVNCDDYGRFDARPAILKARLFPLKDRVTLKNVEDALVKLAEVGCVKLYRVDSKPFLYLPAWEVHQNVRAKKSRYPEPSEESEKEAYAGKEKASDRNMKSSENICMQMYADDCKCSRNPNPNPNPNPNSESESYSGDVRVDAALEEYKTFRKEIKRPLTDRAMQLAVKKLETLAPDDPDRKIAIIEQSIVNGWIGLFPLKKEQTTENEDRYDDLKEWVKEHDSAGVCDDFGSN